MQLSARSPLTAAAAAVLTAGVVTASPGLGPAGAPRIVSTPVTLLFTAGYHAYIGAYLLDPVHSFTYTPNGSGPSVSHPVGLIPELLGDSRKPPILGALVSGHVHTIQDIPVHLIFDDVRVGYAGTADASIGSVQTSSGHGATATHGHPTAQFGQTAGEEPTDVTTTAPAGH